MNAVNEALIRDVVADVLGRLGQAPTAKSTASPAPAKEACGCGNGHAAATRTIGGRHGVFENANDACSAAHAGFLALQKQGVEARAKIVEIIKSLADANAVSW